MPGLLAIPARLRAALIDPARRERTVLIALAVYTVLWTVYGTIAKSSQGLHYDMVELIAWSRDMAWGFKHPPFAAALVWLWFHIFPLTDWSYYLLAMLMPASALWLIWRLSADYLDGEKRAIGLALMTLVPFFNFHALKYNVNTVLLPLWAATTFAFLRSYQTRRAGWAALAGALAAGAMLGKYWSVFLLGGLVLAALIGRRRAAYFRSPAPWITVVIGFVVLAPHLIWLTQHDFVSFSYAVDIHADKSFAGSALSALGYLAGSLGYVALPLMVTLIMARPRGAALAGMAWPTGPERQLAAAAFWGPLLLPAVVAPFTGIEITSLWSMSTWTLLPVVLLSPAAVKVRAVDTCRILGLALVLPVVMLIVSPLIAIQAQRAGPLASSAQARLLAQAIERDWHALTPQPLRFVGGSANLAFGVIAYAADAPRALPELMPPPKAELERDGLVLVCFAANAGCKHDATVAAARVGPSSTVDVKITRNFLGFAGKPQRYIVLIVPPRR